MANEGKIPVSIHLVNTQKIESTSFDEMVYEVMELVNQDNGNFKEANINKRIFNKFKVRLFYSYAQYPPKWRGFLEPLLDKRSPLAQAENLNYSYICLVGLDNELFAITGGYDGQKIHRLMVPNFGLEILVRLFEKDSKVVKNIQDRGLTGNLLGQTKFYRGDQRFSDENQFGKIFKLVQADLNKAILKEVFGFTEGQLKREKSACMAKESFQINKAVDFEMMLSIVEKLAIIMKGEANFSLNKVEHINPRNSQYQQLISELNAWAKNGLYNECKNEDVPDVDFCHKKFDEFLTADSIELLIDKGEPIEIPRHSGFGDVIRLLKKSGNYFDSEEELFNASVLSRKVISYNSEGEKLTSGTVFEHLHGEFFYKEKTYFLLDSEWYVIQPTFIKELNNKCKEILRYAWDTSTLHKQFEINRRESIYNQKYINLANYFVFDTITPENIESCDIMKYDDNSIYLIHVKKGFDNSIRDLASQINIAAKLIREDLRTGFQYIEKLEKQTKRSKVGDLGKQSFPKNGLASLFKGKGPQQIIFCLAFADKYIGGRSLRDEPHNFRSNIAKFSLLELRKELSESGFGFRVIQLNCV